MSTAIILVVLDLLGLAAIWFYVRFRLRRALELEGLVEGLRKEVRVLNIELNETTDRNVSLIEDRMEALRGLLDEADRRMGLVRRELENGSREREVYTRLGKLNPRPASSEPAGDLVVQGEARAPGLEIEDTIEIGAKPEGKPVGEILEALDASGEPIRLSLGKREERDRRELPQEGLPSAPEPGRATITLARESVIPRKSPREEAVELYAKGFSSELIAARLGITVAETDLLISLEEGRRGRGV